MSTDPCFKRAPRGAARGSVFMRVFVLLMLNACTSGTISPLLGPSDDYLADFELGRDGGGSPPDAGLDAGPIAADAGADAVVAQDCERCGGASCVDLTANDHCGACDVSCAQDATCVAGQCVCAAGLTLCNGTCVETSSDPDNCLACGVQCGTGELCTPTGCRALASCGQLTRCGSACVDVSSSFAHCGGCDLRCGSEQVCSEGSCTCATGRTMCGGSCIDTSSDRLHCGACGNVCGADQVCSQGACSCPGPVATFAEVASSLERNCANTGCHTGMSAKAGLSLTINVSYAELVGVTTTQCGDGRLLVEPGAPKRSYLMHKLLGTDLCAGTQMPKAGTSIPTAERDAIANWICRGAPR